MKTAKQRQALAGTAGLQRPALSKLAQRAAPLLDGPLRSPHQLRSVVHLGFVHFGDVGVGLLGCDFGLLGFDLLRLDCGEDAGGGLLNYFQALGQQSGVAVMIGAMRLPVLSVVHYGPENGDAMRDPEMVFYGFPSRYCVIRVAIPLLQNHPNARSRVPFLSFRGTALCRGPSPGSHAQKPLCLRNHGRRLRRDCRSGSRRSVSASWTDASASRPMASRFAWTGTRRPASCSVTR